jgi:uncharacterized protein YabN with tetrapyrrole methylase and pyrophosphatase domain
MNLLHTKSRNRLSVQVLDKLSFIYINTRALRKDLGVILDEEYIQDSILDLEDDLIIAEYFQRIFQSTIPKSVLGKRRREDIDVVKAQQVINKSAEAIKSTVREDNFLNSFDFDALEWTN